MPKNDPIQELEKIVSRLEKTLDKAISPKEAKALGEQAIELVRVRTRLGYGVKSPNGNRSRLKALTPKYIKFRRRFKRLSEFTRPSRSNLTLTGQMLDSLKLKTRKQKDRNITIITPSGSRRGGGPSNLDVATYQAEQGRIFNNMSKNETNQLLRFYRKRFGDLLRNSRLTFKR